MRLGPWYYSALYLTLLLLVPENARIEVKLLASDPSISHSTALKSLLICLRFLVATSLLSTRKTDNTQRAVPEWQYFFHIFTPGSRQSVVFPKKWVQFVYVASVPKRKPYCSFFYHIITLSHCVTHPCIITQH